MAIKKIFLTTILTFLLVFTLVAQDKVSTLITNAETKIDAIDAKILETEGKIQAAFDSVKSLNKYIEKLDSARLLNLPVGILGPGKDPRYGILIDDVMLRPEGAYFNASMLLTNPFDGSRMCFQAQNIPFSFSGGIIGDARIMLVSQKKFTISDGVLLYVLPGTYVEFNCNGFKALNLKGKVVFSGDKFVKVNADGDSIPGALETYFETTVNDWNNLYVSIDKIDPFKLKSVPDIIFSCKNLAIDYSDFRNPDNMIFPASYASTFPNGSANLWRGVYMAEATIMLDKKFKKKGAKELTSFSAKNLLIDEKGLSGELTGKNVLGLEDGDMNSWSFSMDNIYVKLDASRLVKATFAGQLLIPAFKDSSKFSYSALIDTEGKYNFTVTTQKDLPFELFGESKLNINKSSYISITLDKGKFKPVASLTGSLDISVSNMKMAGVRFEELRIATEAPIISVKNLAVDGGQQGAFAKFPLTVNNVEFKMPGDNVSLKFDVKLNLINSSDEGFSGLCNITLLAKRNNYKFKLTGVQINEIKVDVVKDGAYEIHGQIKFAREDPIYGNGFRGMIQAKFSSTFDLKALAIFGNVKGDRYFFVDAFFGMKPGIQAGPITLFGFSGGLYYHMKQKKGANPDSSSFGSSLSGLVYQPDPTIGIGIMAGIKFGVVKEQLIDADVKFEIVFNASGGLNRVYFEGKAKCIVPNVDVVPAALKEAAQKFAGGEKLPFNPVDAAIAASVTMEMDFEKHSFHSMLEVFINVGPIIKGVGQNGRAGWCVLHIDPDKWYLHIGSPTDPIGLKFLSLFETRSYFMVGYDIPTELPLNPQVAEILNIKPGDLAMNRDNSQLATGKGIAFGTSFRFNTGDLTFLVFYASFDFGAGFDIMLTDYGSKSYCEGHQPPVGINGWYAKGQIYAYLKGQVGIKAKIFRKTRRFEILNIAVAALLRAEAPNPTYMLGMVGGQYRVFGGLIKGQCKFKVEVGEKCQLVKVKDSPSPTDIPVIGDITPAAESTEVDVFATPQVVFNLPVDKEFKVSDDNEITKLYRIKLNKLELNQENGSAIVVNSNWNADHSVISLEPDEILNPKNKYTLNVEISFEEKVGYTWQAVLDNGLLFTEKRSVTFTTGLLPDKIPAQIIKYSYPADKQYNFYKSEYPQAYMAFTRNISIFFADDNDFTKEVQWADASGKKIHGKLTYNTTEKTVYADVPGNLANAAIYSLNFVAVPRNTNTGSDRNVTTSQTSVDLGDSTTADVTTKQATGTLSNPEEKTFCSYNFRTSKFNTFKEKIPFDNKEVFALISSVPFVYYPLMKMPINEVFDKYELYGDGDYTPFIRRTAVLNATNWYQDVVYPLVYQRYPWFNTSCIDYRDTSVVGVPAKKDIQFYYQTPVVLTDDEIATGIGNSQNNGTETMVYRMPYYWDHDYYMIRCFLANRYPTMTATDPLIDKILKSADFPAIIPGDYPVLLEYVLPGKNVVTTSKYITLKNNIKLYF
jgi:hypothetical protein